MGHEGNEADDNVEAAIREFGFRLLTARNQAGFTNFESLASKAERSTNTIANACAGKLFPTRATVEAIAKACAAAPMSNHLPSWWDEAYEVISKKSPRHGQAWPKDTPGVVRQPRTASLASGSIDSDNGLAAEPDGTPELRDPSGEDEQTYLDPGVQSTLGDLHIRLRGHRAALIIGLLGVVSIVGAIVYFGHSSPPEAQIKFNSLGGTTSKYVQVYRGVSGSPSDKEPTGTFPDGETATAICRATGRVITSDIKSGEKARSSNQWVRLKTPPGAPRYASLTYADADPTAVEKLATCQ